MGEGLGGGLVGRGVGGLTRGSRCLGLYKLALNDQGPTWRLCSAPNMSSLLKIHFSIPTKHRGNI